MNIKYKILLPTVLLTLIICSSISLAAGNDLAINEILEKFSGTVNDGTLNTNGALFTDVVPRLVLAIMIVISTWMYLMGELNGTAVTVMRIILASAFALNLGMYFNDNFFNMTQYSHPADMPPAPDVESANFINAFMSYFIWICQKGADNLYPYSIAILVALSAIDMATHLMMKAETDIFKYIIANTLKIGIYVWLLSNWVAGIGIASAVAISFEKLGFIAASVTDQNLQPAQIFSNALTILEQATKMVSSVNGIPATLISLILFILILAAILYCAIQLFMARVEFWVMAVLTMPLIALGTFKYFRFLFEKTISAVINAGIKIMVVTFIMSIITPMMTELIHEFEKASGFSENAAAFFQIMFACIVMAAMVYKIPALVQGLINGTPNLSGGDMFSPMQATNQAAARVSSAVGGATGAAAKFFGRNTAASQMPGGRTARGIPGAAGSLKQMAGQISTGQYKGALDTAGQYGKGVAGTLSNRMKMAAMGAYKDKFYKEINDAHNLQQIRSSGKAWTEMYKGQKENPQYAKAVTNHLSLMTKKGQVQDHLENAKRRSPHIHQTDDK